MRGVPTIKILQFQSKYIKIKYRKQSYLLLKQQNETRFEQIQNFLNSMWLFTCLQLVTADLFLSSYDDKIRVTTVFGTGRVATTDSPGLIGEINTPTDLVFDATENYLYITDFNGGGLIRKLVVTTSGFTTDLTSLYSVKTVFAGNVVFLSMK
jgi:hypothetical protein